MKNKRQVVVKKRNGSCISNSSSPTNRSSDDSTNSSPVNIRAVRYGECQKNHAANIGGYAVDGCREFMASAEEGTVGALACAACGCHMNFHRREELDTDQVVSESCSSTTTHSSYYE